MREMLEGISGLPPLNAATTLAPARSSLFVGLLMSSVNATQWDVSHPIIPSRNSALAGVIENVKTGRRQARNFPGFIFASRYRNPAASSIQEKPGSSMFYLFPSADI